MVTIHESIAQHRSKDGAIPSVLSTQSSASVWCVIHAHPNFSQSHSISQSEPEEEDQCEIFLKFRNVRYHLTSSDQLIASRGGEIVWWGSLTSFATVSPLPHAQICASIDPGACRRRRKKRAARAARDLYGRGGKGSSVIGSDWVMLEEFAPRSAVEGDCRRRSYPVPSRPSRPGGQKTCATHAEQSLYPTTI